MPDGVTRVEHNSNYDFNEVSHYIDSIYPFLVSHYTVLYYNDDGLNQDAMLVGASIFIEIVLDLLPPAVVENNL